jgi:hypothetical protein
MVAVSLHVVVIAPDCASLPRYPEPKDQAARFEAKASQFVKAFQFAKAFQSVMPTLAMRQAESISAFRKIAAENQTHRQARTAGPARR